MHAVRQIEGERNDSFETHASDLVQLYGEFLHLTLQAIGISLLKA